MPSAHKHNLSIGSKTAPSDLKRQNVGIPKMAEFQTPTEASLLETTPATVKDTGVQVDTAQLNGTEEPPLFSPTLISSDVAAALPEGYSIRPLRRDDYYNGAAPRYAQVATGKC